MKKIIPIVSSLFLAIAAAEAKVPRGHLVIIGGGATTPAIQRTMVDFSGGTNAVMLAITTAGGAKGSKAGEGFIKSVSKMGVSAAKWAQPTREQSDDPKYVEELLKDVTGVFFTGGKQRHIVEAHRGTLLHRKLMEMYENGAMVGGSSAGAAMMSDPMITGTNLTEKADEKKASQTSAKAVATPKTKHDEPQSGSFKSIAKNQVEIVGGMGFIKNAIIDQHFIKRSRENRLFSVALEHPEYTCFGIDESTAIVVSQGNKIRVQGKSNVMVIKAESPKTIKTNQQGDFGARDLSVHLLLDGDTMEL